MHPLSQEKSSSKDFSSQIESSNTPPLSVQKNQSSKSATPQPSSKDESNQSLTSRRMALATITSTSTAAILLASTSAQAAVAEIDKTTGLRYTPKKEMLAGGSAAARGVQIERSLDNSAKAALKLGDKIQNIYETRFIAYLSRFLINYDDAANSYWKGQTNGESQQSAIVGQKFAEFSESVEIGLADYFVGPYGSYSSLNAMKAGISAKYQAKSKKYEDSQKKSDKGIGRGILRRLADGLPTQKRAGNELSRNEILFRNRYAKQGILNLYTLLKARYKSKSAKVQLAILFSFITNPAIQPTAEIRSLLAEADDVSISKIELKKFFVRDEFTSRTSCKRGGGYAVNDQPIISVDVPPALGANYKVAKAVPTMRCTSRVLRIKVIDGGAGYVKCPEVYIGPPGATRGTSRACVAQAIIDRKGRIESILVLDPGYGYGRNKNRTPPKVIVKPPDATGIEKSVGQRRAIAKAELEYEIASIEMVENGNGYVCTEPPRVDITPPFQEPDWFVDFADLAVLDEPGLNRQTFGASVMEMQRGGSVVYTPTMVKPPPEYSLQRIKDDPIGLIPSIIRPALNSDGSYENPLVASVPTIDNARDNPRFRAVDPLFGAIGALPVQKSAAELKPNEYGRLALSGAVCTVLVRTALNPLELIKTKLQLQNDEELLTYARNKMGPQNPHGGDGESKEHSDSSPTIQSKKSHESTSRTKTTNTENNPEGSLAVAINTTTPAVTTIVATEENVTSTEEAIGSKDLIVSLIDLRGFPAIFQSADITLLASIMFGSLGFGATELFRRSFTFFFYEGGSGAASGGTTLVLLLAATVATIITCAVAAPFELLRVRSMGLVEQQQWTSVMKGFLEEKIGTETKSKKSGSHEEEFDLKSLALKDYVPLWAGFGPTTSRELAFAIPKFLAFDLIAKAIVGLINSQLGQGALPIQVGVGGAGLAISAFSGACAGLAGAFVSHPADLILTRLSASSKPSAGGEEATATNGTIAEVEVEDAADPNWKDIIKELLAKEGGVANLYVGLAPRLVFFFLVIGLQFFLYDYVKNLLEVGSDDLSLVLDVFYAVRQGLIEQSS
eukprot:CAMPEP_0197185590 /NCGR_PEP_ID=MMETSP1423-20130617/12261_1 /TAXON_ID=476441 /ORGANISM="Pseudo-nitzschia heimii, Strain UNC1101" /LENGTH=1071 /DNA_ID=CAMNT_0042636699 /DNA_START=472 /DNA_END=3687 /DNA_ORIENTATION=+